MSADYHPANLGNCNLSEMGIVSCFVKLPLALEALIKGKIRREKLAIAVLFRKDKSTNNGLNRGPNRGQFHEAKVQKKTPPGRISSNF